MRGFFLLVALRECGAFLAGVFLPAPGARVVRELAEEDQLGAVALEVCPSRWDSTLRAQPRGSLLRRICDNEFQAAAEVAERHRVGAALGDERRAVAQQRRQVGGQDVCSVCIMCLYKYVYIYIYQYVHIYI